MERSIETHPNQETLDKTRVVEVIYDRSGLPNLFRAYASGEVQEEPVDFALHDYTGRIAHLAYDGGDIDVDFVRQSFDKISDSFDDIVHEDTRPKGLAAAVYFMLNGKKFPKRQMGNRMDDKFWKEQFMGDYDSDKVPKQPEEKQDEYFSRYVEYCARGYLWAPFTYYRSSY